MNAPTSGPPGRAELRRLVLVGPSPPPVHGVAMMTVELISALQELGALAEHLDTRDPRPVTTLGRLDMRNVVLGLKHAWRLERLLERHRDAGVHISISQSALGFVRDALLVGIARMRRRQLYIQLHGSQLQEIYSGSTRPVQWAIRWVFRQAHQTWALTSSLTTQFDGLVAPERVHVVSNAIADYAPCSDIRPPPAGEESLRLLFLSNVLVEKGCFDLISALSSLGGRAAGWRVRIVGLVPPEIEQRLWSEINALPKSGACVSVRGERRGSQKLAEYEWANAFVFPSRQDEGQPLVLLEALRAGLPIVATRQHGIADTVRHRQEGLLFERHDVRALAAAIEELAADGALRANLGKASRLRYEEMYRAERLVNDLSRLLQRDEW